MALIRCPDCGHKVSDLAFACPQCARPVARLANEEAIRKVRGTSRGSARVALLRPHLPSAEPRPTEASPREAESLPPGLVEWAVQLSSVSATEEATKRCARCGQSVARDAFRAKEAAGYVCGECQNDEMAQAARKRAQLEKWLRLAMAFLLIGAITTAFVGAAATMVQQVDVRPKRK